jgi:hypothetical protein
VPRNFPENQSRITAEETILRGFKAANVLGGLKGGSAAFTSSVAVGNNEPIMSVPKRRGAAMLPYIGPEIIHWLLGWSAQPKDVSNNEGLIAELNQDSSNNKTRKQGLRRTSLGKSAIAMKFASFVLLTIALFGRAALPQDSQPEHSSPNSEEGFGRVHMDVSCSAKVASDFDRALAGTGGPWSASRKFQKKIPDVPWPIGVRP